MFRVDICPRRSFRRSLRIALNPVDRTVGNAWRVAADSWGNNIALQERPSVGPPGGVGTPDEITAMLFSERQEVY